MIPEPALGPVFLVASAVLGSIVGSFLNVCIHRLPRRSRSIVHPPSHCPACGSRIRARDNIPILSFLCLWGKCRDCRTRISWRYPLVELLTALLFLWLTALWLDGRHTYDQLTASQISLAERIGVLLVSYGLVGALLVATFVDLRYRIIPDEISLFGMVLGPILCAALPSVLHQIPFPEVIRHRHLAGFLASLLGAVVGGGSIYLVAVFGKMLFRKEAMGFGDVKLLAMIGAYLGWDGALLTFLVACLVGAICGGILLLLTRERYTPFGPYLAFGALVVHVYHTTVTQFLFETWPSWIRMTMGMSV